MRCFRSALLEFLRREDGPTAVEYAMMAVLILVVCYAAVTTVGTNTNKTYTKVNNTISSSS
jgi:pilus assembly protein Flp/PilA